jgi:hypothetical protein
MGITINGFNADSEAYGADSVGSVAPGNSQQQAFESAFQDLDSSGSVAQAPAGGAAQAPAPAGGATTGSDELDGILQGITDSGADQNQTGQLQQVTGGLEQSGAERTDIADKITNRWQESTAQHKALNAVIDDILSVLSSYLETLQTKGDAASATPLTEYAHAGVGGGPQHQSGEVDKLMTPDEMLSDPAAVDIAGSRGIEIEGFMQQFDVDKDGNFGRADQEALGKFATQLSQSFGKEVHVGVSQDNQGNVRAIVTSGDHDSVVGQFPSGTPIFGGHTHPNGTEHASDTDLNNKISQEAAVWTPNGESTYY